MRRRFLVPCVAAKGGSRFLSRKPLPSTKRPRSPDVGSCTSSHGPPAALRPHLEEPLRRRPTVAEMLGVPSGQRPERQRKPRPSRLPLAGGRVGPGAGPWLAGELPIFADIVP